LQISQLQIGEDDDLRGNQKNVEDNNGGEYDEEEETSMHLLAHRNSLEGHEKQQQIEEGVKGDDEEGDITLRSIMETPSTGKQRGNDTYVYVYCVDC
jgi:hypothetical protein